MAIKEKMNHFIKRNYKLILISLLLAIIGHLFFLSNQFMENQYMMGSGDQLSQMIIFKDLLYDEFSSGNFFYSFFLNGGSNLISRLSYYYSTSLLFYLSVLFTYILETLTIIQTPSMTYWASLAVFVSIFRSILILFTSTKYINLFVNNQKYSLLGASFYTFSTIYFRHVALWEFFADGMIWLPIILYGVEMIIRKNDGKIFAIGVALTLFNNGYFAYKNLLFTFIYIILRLVIKISQNENKFIQQIKSYTIYGLIGLGISLPGFLPFVIGFFNTSRLSPEFTIPLLETVDFNIGRMLLSDQVQIIPILFIFVGTYFLNYKSKTFNFFSIFSLVLIILRYSTYVASIFNGFGYLQFRWHYLTFLMMGVAIAIGVRNIIRDLIQQRILSSIFIFLATVITLGLYVYADSQITDHYFNMKIIYGIILSILIICILSQLKANRVKYVVPSLLFVTSLYTIYVSNEQLYDEYNLEQMDYEKIYTTFDDPNNPYDRALNFIDADSDRFHRIDFTDMNNLASQKEFSSFNVYNSFQNKFQQYFYRYFQIINNRESNGIIDGLAGRQILSSVFQSDYVIAAEDNEYIVPTGFTPIEQVEDLTIFKNTIPLAFIHPVHNLYSENDLNEYQFKDELLVDGAIVEDDLSNKTLNSHSQATELEYELSAIHTDQQGNKLLSSDDSFNVEIDLDSQDHDYDDIVIDYTIKPSDSGKNGNYPYSINGNNIELKSTGNPYSSQLYRHQAHIPYDDEVIFNLSPGTDYTFEIHSIYGVTHDSLIQRSQSDQDLEYDLQIDHGEINIDFNNEDNYPLMTLPLFYEKGWQLEINGNSSEILNVNHGMVGFEIPNGEVNIRLSYRQPYLLTTIFISIASIFIFVYFERKKVYKEHSYRGK